MTGRTVVSADGTPIWFDDSEGDGPVVILLHGASMTSRSNFDMHFGVGNDGRIGPTPGPTFVSLLRHLGARVVTVDARGHGHSGRSGDPERYRGDAHANDVLAAIDAVGAEAVDVIGYSMGSMTAARLLALAPDRLRSVALCGTRVSHFGTTSESIAGPAECGRRFQVNDFEGSPVFKMFRYQARLDPVHDFESIGAAMIGMETVPVAGLARVPVPVLVANGGGDNVDGDADYVASLIPGATATVVGEANHGMACSDPLFLNAVVSFASQRWTAT